MEADACIRKFYLQCKKTEGEARCFAPYWSRPPDEDQGAVTFCLIRSTSAAVVAASIQEVSAIAAATAAKQENQDPHAAVVTETISAAIVAASAAAGEKKDDPKARRHSVSVFATASAVSSC